MLSQSSHGCTVFQSLNDPQQQPPTLARTDPPGHPIPPPPGAPKRNLGLWVGWVLGYGNSVHVTRKRVRAGFCVTGTYGRARVSVRPLGV